MEVFLGTLKKSSALNPFWKQLFPEEGCPVCWWALQHRHAFLQRLPRAWLFLYTVDSGQSEALDWSPGVAVWLCVVVAGFSGQHKGGYTEVLGVRDAGGRILFYFPVRLEVLSIV